MTWLLLHDGSIVDYTCNLVFNARCISSTGAERRLNYFRTVQVGNNETKCFEMFWTTSFRFLLIISARFRYSKIVQTCVSWFFDINRMEAPDARQIWSRGAERRAWGAGNSLFLGISERALSEMDSLGPRYSGSGDIGYWFVEFRGPGGSSRVMD